MSTQPNHSGQLMALPVENFGWKLKRSRMQVAGWDLAEAVAAAAEFTSTSTATVARLEKKAEPPRNWGKDKDGRQLATILCVLYGVDPAELDLTTDDLPPGIRTALDRRGHLDTVTESATPRYLFAEAA